MMKGGFTRCLQGMGDLLADELGEPGCVAAATRGIVTFGVFDMQIIPRVVLWCRAAHKILQSLLVASSEDSYSDSVCYTCQNVYEWVRDRVHPAALTISG